MFLLLLDDCMKMKTTELLYSIDETLYDVFDAQTRHNESALKKEMNQEVCFRDDFFQNIMYHINLCFSNDNF